MIEYDIDLSNLSKKAQNNFRKYYQTKKRKGEFKRNLRNMVIILLAWVFFPAIFAGTAHLICKYIFNNNSDVIPHIFTVIGYIPFIYVIYKLSKSTDGQYIKKFFDEFSKDGVFNYCFECNKEITPTDDKKCPVCNNSVKLNTLENHDTFNHLITKRERKIIITKFMLLLLVMLPLLLMAVTIIIFSAMSSLMSFGDTLYRASFDFEHKNYQYLEATPMNMDDTEKNVSNKIIRYENGIPVKGEDYMSFGFPKIERFMFGSQSKYAVKNYCEDYNSHMKKYIDGTYKKGELGTVKTFGSSRFTYQKYLNSCRTLTKLRTRFFIDDKIKFDYDKTGVITALIINKDNGIKYIITDQNNKEYTRKGFECKLIKTKNGETNVRNKTK